MLRRAKDPIPRRLLFKKAAFWAAAACSGGAKAALQPKTKPQAATPPPGSTLSRPNVLFVLADQWRGQALGFAGDGNARTPNLNAFAEESIRFSLTVSNCPVCSPYRASLLTGQYPLTHGVFLNDVPLLSSGNTLGEVFARAGYETGWIGKWHLEGRGSRSAFIPRHRRKGFKLWKAQECTHNYNRSYYWDDDVRKLWKGYDAEAQTEAAIEFIREQAGRKPFLLFLSWGPPHAPYHTAPGRYRRLFSPQSITLRPNVPAWISRRAKRDLAGYYAHIAALDDCFGRLLNALSECAIAEDTIVVFTSDHGDMLGSQGHYKKQRPWDESICVPFLLRWPRKFGSKGRVIPGILSTTDIFPTLAGLCGLKTPKEVEGKDLSKVVLGEEGAADSVALITCPSPFGQWTRSRGGKEYRGIRTLRYTYVEDLHGPWLLYDNFSDPFQLKNLLGTKGIEKVRRELRELLHFLLERQGDEFLPGPVYIAHWGWRVTPNGTAPYLP